MGSQGINVPDDPACIERNVRDSAVQEYYNFVEDAEAREEQLVSLGRKPVRSLAHQTKGGNINVFGLYWQEPREIG